MRILRPRVGPTGARLYPVQLDDGRPASWSLYWNGPGARLLLGFSPDRPGGQLVTIDAAGFDAPIPDAREADRLAAAFLDTGDTLGKGIRLDPAEDRRPIGQRTRHAPEDDR